MKHESLENFTEKLSGKFERLKLVKQMITILNEEQYNNHDALHFMLIALKLLLKVVAIT